VRQTTLDDIPAVIGLQRRAFPGMPPWTAEQLTRHLEVFPDLGDHPKPANEGRLKTGQRS
jgi:hypothetical protein